MDLDLDDCYRGYTTRATVTRELTQNQNSDLVNIAALLDDFDLESINLSDTNITLNNVDVNYVVANSISVADIVSDIDFNNFVMSNMTIEATDLGLTTPGDAVINDLTIIGPMYAPDGTVSLPAYSFTNDPDTGIYAYGTDTLSITTGGTERARFDANGLTVSDLVGLGGSLNINSYLEITGPIDISTSVYVSDGTVSNPTYSFTNDTDTGIYASGTGGLSITAGGTERARFDSAGLNVDTLGSLGPGLVINTDVTVTGAGGVTVEDLIAQGDIFYAGSLTFTSDARVKSNITDADPRACYSLVRAMQVHEFTKCGRNSIGVIAQELEQLDPRLVVHSRRSFTDSNGAYQDDLLAVDLDRLVGVILGGLKHVISRLDEL
jgi:hypothetical protein